MYAALRALPIPDDEVVRLFHAASLLREHRGDGHIAALMIEGVGGLEAHVLFALDMGMPAEKFGRIHHLPAAQIAAVIDGTPRVVVVGFYWTGDEFVISTAATAPKVAALAAHPEVALAIDAGDTPGGARSLSVRGQASVEIVDGVVPEYLAAARRSMDTDAAVKFEQNVRRMYDQMARIAIRPTWARFYDFGAGRMPRFLQELAARSQMTEADWAD